MTNYLKDKPGSRQMIDDTPTMEDIFIDDDYLPTLILKIQKIGVTLSRKNYT